MHLLPVFILIICLFSSGCDTLKGPSGPEGPRGDKGSQGPRGDKGSQGLPGKSFEFTVMYNTLDPGDPDYWAFRTKHDLRECIVSVRVSSDRTLDAEWIEPIWWFKSYVLWIINDEKADSGDYYRIIIASELD